MNKKENVSKKFFLLFVEMSNNNELDKELTKAEFCVQLLHQIP